MGKEIRGIIMRKVILLLILGLFLAGCSQMQNNLGNPFSFGSSSEKDAGLQQENLQFGGPKNGIVVNFRKGTPNDPINGKFGVIVDIANYMDDFSTVKLDVWDSTLLTGFNSVKGTSHDVGPVVFDDRGVYSNPGIKTVDLGKFTYVGVRDGSKTKFFAKVEYLGYTETEVTFCVTDIFSESSTNCPESQSLSGAGLGEGNSRAPVTVRSVNKKHGGGDGSATLDFDIKISDVGRGRVIDLFEEGNPDMNIVEFNILPQDGLSESFRCSSDDAVDQTGRHDSGAGNLPMQIKLEKGSSADVLCSTDVSVDSAIKNVRAKIAMEYRYEYSTETSEIKVASGVSRASLT